MNPAKTLARVPTPLFPSETRNLCPNIKWAVRFYQKDPLFMPTRSVHVLNSVRAVASDFSSAGVSHNRKRERLEIIEENIEKVKIFFVIVFYF